jgi:hypothetical protein
MSQKEAIHAFLADKKTQTYFHSTFDDFDEFDFSKSDFAMHLGSREAALNRIDIKILEDERLGGYGLKNKKEHPILLEVLVTLNNPITLNENRTGQWQPYDVVREVIELAEREGVKGVTEQEIDDYYEDALSFKGIAMVDLDSEDYGGESFNTALKEQHFVRDWLQSKGYDGIVYQNDFEGGGDSIMIFDNAQKKIVNKERLTLNPDEQNKTAAPKRNKRP